MNILFLTYAKGLAGSSQSLRYLSEGLASIGHKVWIGCPQDSQIAQLVQGSAVEVIPMTFRGKADWSNIKHIAQVVKSCSIDIISPQSTLDRYTASFAKSLYRLPAKIVHVRRQMPKNNGIWLVNWFIRSTVAKVVAVSWPVKEAIQKRQGLPSSMVPVIRNGTPTSKYELDDHPDRLEGLKSRYGIKEGDFVIGCVSRLKNQRQILEALGTIDRPVHVIFVGIERQDGWQDIIDQWPVPHAIHFTGHIDPTEALYHYPLFDLKVLASTMEGLSQSLLEAMAMGVPVIASAAGGNTDLIQPGVNGLLFNDGDIPALSGAISNLLTDDNRRERLASAGKKTAWEDFSIEKTINGYEELFESLIGGE